MPTYLDNIKHHNNREKLEMINSETKTFIFTTSSYKANTGVFDNGNFQMVVEVNKLQGSASYGFGVDGNWGNAISRVDAEQAWKDLEAYLGAVVVTVDAKYIKDNFKEVLKPYLDAKKVVRKKLKEERAARKAINEGV